MSTLVSLTTCGAGALRMYSSVGEDLLEERVGEEGAEKEGTQGWASTLRSLSLIIFSSIMEVLCVPASNNDGECKFNNVNNE